MIPDYIIGSYAGIIGLDKVFDVLDIGYRITIISNMNFIVGDRYKIYIVNINNEYNRRSFGFTSKIEREMFEKLICIKGIGPNTAMLILMNSSIDKINDAIINKDVNFFMKFPKIGYKTASLIVGGSIVNKDDDIKSSILYQGLINLGFESKKVIESLKLVDHTLTDQEKLKHAMTIIVKKT